MPVYLILGQPSLNVSSHGDGAVSVDISCRNHPLNGVRLLFDRDALALLVSTLDRLLLQGGEGYLPTKEAPQMVLSIARGEVTLTLPTWKPAKPSENDSKETPKLVLTLPAVRKLVQTIRKMGGAAFLAT